MASTISKAASGRGSLSIRLRRDSYPLLFIMTSVGGFCASYSFLARGGVFAFAQTGNIIYSGHVMASGHFLGVLTFLFPILSYMLGLFLSQQLRDRQADLVTFEKIILLFQSLLMTLSASCRIVLPQPALYSVSWACPQGFRCRPSTASKAMNTRASWSWAT